jgi:signal transduction histidine kinase
MPSSAKPVRSLARQLVARLSLIVAIMAMVLASLTYLSVDRLTQQYVPILLLQTAHQHAEFHGRSFQQALLSVQRLANAWQERHAALSDTQVARQFAELFERQADGVWRLRPAQVNLTQAPTFYLQHGPHGPDLPLQRRVLTSYQLLREQGPALVPPYFSAYTDFVEKGLMVYSPSLDWGQSATTQTDNFNYPTMQGAAPQNNPQRRSFFTPLYFDSEARAWMVSVIQPLDLQGQWVGTMGHDITVDQMLEQVSQSESTLGALSMLIDKSGHLIAHPHLRERIAEASGRLNLRELQDPVLLQVLAMLQQHGLREGSSITADGRHLVAWSPMAGPDWWSVRILPKARVDEVIHSGLLLALGLAALCVGITVVLLRRVIIQRVRRPVDAVTLAIESLTTQVRQGQEPQPLPRQRSAELQRLALAFDAMAADLAQHQRQEQASLAALEREVQERRLAEDEVRQLNLSLEERVLERSEALQHAQNELVQRETLASLGALVAGVSHELNTPIGNALMASDTAAAALQALQKQLASGQAMRRSDLTQQIAQARQGVALALGNLQRSAELVQEFKQVAVDRASLQRRCFNLRRVTEEVVHLLHYSLKKGHQYRVEIELPEEVQLDSYPGAFGQVMTNLVQNAVLHGFEGREQGRIRIRLLEADTRRVRLQVSDDGRGIPPEHLQQVFKPFFTTKLGQGGSGLGLHLVYNIVSNVLGGRIELHSQPGQGTVFILELPRLAPQ